MGLWVLVAANHRHSAHHVGGFRHGSHLLPVIAVVAGVAASAFVSPVAVVVICPA
jgi:hypothetical protein